MMIIFYTLLSLFLIITPFLYFLRIFEHMKKKLALYFIYFNTYSHHNTSYRSHFSTNILFMVCLEQYNKFLYPMLFLFFYMDWFISFMVSYHSS